VLGASIFLPFLPMQPIQVLTNNVLYDFSQTTIPTDAVDAEWLTKPRKWTIGEIQRFILFIGPISSIFDYLTFFIMLYVFNAWTTKKIIKIGEMRRASAARCSTCRRPRRLPRRPGRSCA